MTRIWPWRHTPRPAQLSPTVPQFDDFDIDSLSDPYSTLSVQDDAGEGAGTLVALRNFADPDDATRAQVAWQRHRPELTVRLRHDIRSSPEPSFKGFYLAADGTWHDGQPAEVDAVIAQEIAAAEERAAQQARESAQRVAALKAREAKWAAEREARRPQEMVLAEAGDDAPFPHHAKFLKATQTFVAGRPVDRPVFHFAAFTARDPEPVAPDSVYRSVATEREQEQSQLARDEYKAARKAWAKAVYRARAESVLRSAALAWPKVAEAFAAIDRAWKDLDHPPYGWEVAVKQLLDAHDAARPVVQDWEEWTAKKLATIGTELVDDRGALAELREQLGAALGIDGVQDWRIGHPADYRPGDRYFDLEDGAHDHLRTLVDTQRQRLAEITAAAAGPVAR